MKIPVPLRPPPSAQCHWWALGVFKADGTLEHSANLIVPEVRLKDVVDTARGKMLAFKCEHVMVTSGEPDHETLYEEKRGEVLVNRLGT